MKGDEALQRLRSRHETALIPAHRRDAPLVVGGRHDGQGWKVMVFFQGSEAGRAPLMLEAAAARELAEGLQSMADVIEGKRW